jgi:F-type H+-transporting ATPase subunit epsilon
MAFAWKASGLTYVNSLCSSQQAFNLADEPSRASINNSSNRYNKYLSVAARVVRRSLKDDKRLAAERRGQMELRFAKWNVSVHTCLLGRGFGERFADGDLGQNGKQGEVKSVAEANAASMAEHGSQSSS